MHNRAHRLHRAFFRFRVLFSEEFVALLLVLFVFAAPVGATTRFENRSLFMSSVTPGATSSYKISLDYMTPEPVGSLDIQFCMSPIPYDPCEKPQGLNINNATLESQTGEIGFALQVISDTHLVLSRAPQMISGPGSKSTYTLNNITNPSDLSESFSIRLKSFGSSNASGPSIDFGSVRGDVGDGISITTQVPPMLIFCAAEVVDENCFSTNENYFSDMGSLSKDNTLTAQSQFAVGTNATAGFVVTANGGSLTSGTSIIDGSTVPSQSKLGSNQFGINLVANTQLSVGHDPEGTWMNALPTTDYAQPNLYKYVSGDAIASSPNVSLIKKFTVSYIVNVNPSLKAGVYTTTINYIASGRF